MPSFFVGIDVSQKKLDVFIEPIKRTIRFQNTNPGHQRCVKELQALGVNPSQIRVVLESTGGFELSMALALQEAGFEVAIIKPERARFFAKASGKIAKTDAIDAAVLAHFCQVIPLSIIPLPNEEIRQFRDLLDRRQQLLEMKIMESNRMKTTFEKSRLKAFANILNGLTGKLLELSLKLTLESLIIRNGMNLTESSNPSLVWEFKPRAPSSVNFPNWDMLIERSSPIWLAWLPSQMRAGRW